MLAPFGVEQGKTLTSVCPGQGQTDSRTTTHSKFSWFPKLPDSNSQRGPWVTDVPPDAGRHPLRYQSELETGSLVPNFYHGSAVWLKGPKAKCQRGHVITWLYKIYIRQVKLTRYFPIRKCGCPASKTGFKQSVRIRFPSSRDGLLPRPSWLHILWGWRATNPQGNVRNVRGKGH